MTPAINESKTSAPVLIVLGVVALFALSACTHIKVVAFDKRQNTVTIQGGKWATDDDYQQAADEYCKGSASLLAMDETMVGSYTTVNAQSYGRTTNAYAISSPIRRYDKTFSCIAGQ